MKKKKGTATILAILFGFLGVHQLYLRKFGGFIFFIMLLVFSVGTVFPLGVLISWIQAFRYATMSQQEFDRKYNRDLPSLAQGPMEVRRQEQLRRSQQIPSRPGNQSRTPGVSPQTAQKVNKLKISGIKKYKDFDLQDAIEDFNEALKLAPNDIALHFNLACAYSLTEKKELSFSHLARAVNLGMTDSERILSHDDLAYIRIQPEFESFKASGFKTNPFAKKLTVEKDDEPITSSAKNTVDETLKLPENDESILAKLNKLSELKSRGILSDEEFMFERNKVLRSR